MVATAHVHWWHVESPDPDHQSLEASCACSATRTFPKNGDWGFNDQQKRNQKLRAKRADGDAWRGESLG